jgi:hypothetical protein
MLRRPLMMSCSLLALVACGEPPPDLSGDGVADLPGNVTQIAPVHPRAAISGAVVDALSGMPLDGVGVHAVSGTFEASTTTVGGAWSFGDLPAGGEGRITLSFEGFMSTSLTFTTDDAAGDFPSDNNTHDQGVVGLLRSAPVTLMVLGARGQPLTGAQVALRLPFSHLRLGQAIEAAGATSVIATTGGDGSANFLGLVDVSEPMHHLIGDYRLAISVAANGAASGAESSLLLSSAIDLGRYPTLIVDGDNLMPLTPAGGQLRVLASNASDLIQRRQQVSMIDVDEAVRVVFDRPVESQSVVVQLSDERGELSLPINVVWDARGEILTIQPIGTPALLPGREVNLSLSALPADGGGAFNGSANLFTPGPESPFPNENVSVLDWTDTLGDEMINGGDYLTLLTELPIGGRLANGTAAHGSRLVEYVFLAPLDPLDSVLGEQDYSVGDIPVHAYANLLEANPIGDASTSGFTRTIRLRMPPAANFSSGMGLSVRIRLIFDNPHLLTHQNRARTVAGAALTRYDVRLNLP